MRAGLNRYLISPPYNRQINIITDKSFQAANQVYEGKIKEMKKNGKVKTQHKPAIDQTDMMKFYTSGVLANNNPKSLQRKVFFEVSLHFGRRGREGWRCMTRNSFSIKKDPQGLEYVTMAYEEHDKNHQDDEEKFQCMFARPDDDLCPVYSFKLLLSKLNPNCEALLQRPLQNYQERDIWYSNAPLGVNTIANLMKEISKESGSSVTYTNHSIKASTATILKRAGFESMDIMAVTGHRNVASLGSYAKGPTIQDRAKMSQELASFGKGKENEANVTEICIKQHQEDSPSTSVQNQTKNVSYEQSISSIFAGAVFSGNVTINVQVNK
jgi:hypothetical protein